MNHANSMSFPHPRALAFLGDAVFELHVRKLAVAQDLNHSKDLHAFSTARVRAESQVALLHRLQEHLTPDEQEWVRQGRNLGVASARRSGQAAYRQATGFEVLLGALSLCDPERLHALLALMTPWLTEKNWEAGLLEEAAHGVPEDAAAILETLEESDG